MSEHTDLMQKPSIGKRQTVATDLKEKRRAAKKTKHVTCWLF